jgi:hypothetical protein
VIQREKTLSKTGVCNRAIVCENFAAAGTHKKSKVVYEETATVSKLAIVQLALSFYLYAILLD